jgi:hypothetical protein
MYEVSTMPTMRRGISAVGVVALLIGVASCSGEGARALTVAEFSFPWADEPAPRTVFRAHTDGGLLHFAFDADDADVIVSEDWGGESTVDGEDRVEIFFAKDPGLADYWCIEIDPLGRVHDYHARHYRVFDGEWDCPGLKTEGNITPAGYAVRGSIPLATLSELTGRPIGRGSELRVGLFRAEFRGEGPAACGEADDNWISWVRPAVEKPDFHVPDAFRTIVVP